MLFEKVRSILVDQLDITPEEVAMESTISHVAYDLGADSLVAIDMLTSLEEEFDVAIPGDKLKHMVTIGDIVRFLETNLSLHPAYPQYA